MAELDVKTISCSSKITAKIEVNIGSLECEYYGKELSFQKNLTIDSGKGSKYSAKIGIFDFGVGRTKFFQLSIDDVLKLDYCDMNILLNGKIRKNFEIRNALNNQTKSTLPLQFVHAGRN